MADVSTNLYRPTHYNLENDDVLRKKKNNKYVRHKIRFNMNLICAIVIISFILYFNDLSG